MPWTRKTLVYRSQHGTVNLLLAKFKSVPMGVGANFPRNLHHARSI